MNVLRRISTKWILTVLAVVCIPFVGFAWYVDTQTAKRQWEVVRYYLLTMACDLAAQLDGELHERALDIELQAENLATVWAVEDLDGGRIDFAKPLQSGFDRFVQKSQVYDLILAVDADGRFVASNVVRPDGAPFSAAVRLALEQRDYRAESWFQAALVKRRGDERQSVLVDHHRSELLPPVVEVSTPHPQNYHVGFAVPVYSHLEPDRVVGVTYALMRWDRIQEQILKRKRPKGSEALDGVPDSTSYQIYRTSYAWLWTADAETIIAHPTTSLYGARVSRTPVNLPQLVDAARAEDMGFYPEYSFKEKRKNAAFKHCAGPEKGGLGWVVGVGIDNDDVTSFIEGLQETLIQATLSVLAIVVVLTVFIARRTTAPIVALREQTKRVAAGDLTARVTVQSRDELGELAQSFNEMTEQLAQSRKQLIKAEKDAAWREMARQVAHEIKNPLTPISLSAALLKRAKDEKSPEFDSIFERTIQLVTRQVEHMRKIASDFSAFAGAKKRAPEVVELGGVLDDVLAEHAAWAAEARVVVERSGGGGKVLADASELRRLLINLVSNAIEAMPQGGKLDVRLDRVVEDGAPKLRLVVRDTGVGLSDTVRARLFEPYFTTRTHGTGLGLAICARLVDEMGGTIELENLPPEQGPGAIARITLPEHPGA
ncbi:MAG: HAMP domain-containing protein [Planctomycetes bacterium]|nr:HAMP domain-containing protein [Planctomycetota bacterium]